MLPSPGVVNGDGSSATPRELIYLHVQKKNQAKEKYIKFACQDKGIEFAKKESALSTSHVPQRATPPFTMVEETEKVVATWFGPVCSPSASRPSPCANTGPRRRRWMVLVSFLRCPKAAVYTFAFWMTKPIRFGGENVRGSLNEFYTNMLV